jgi:predicted regulator of Ras-like GTPase activity (Roadblock/LC7/MglB family)
MEYAIIKRDGTFLGGEIPPTIEVEKFCIMCAAAFGAGTTALKEYKEETRMIKILGEGVDIIIKPWKNNLLAVIGNEEDVEEVEKKLRG